MEIFLFVSQYFSISRMKKFVASTWFSTHDQPLFIFICNFNEIHRREIFLRNRENQSTRNDPYNFHIRPKFERTNWWSILKRSSYPLKEKAGTRRLIRRNSPILEKLGLDERDHRGISINQDGFAIQFRGSSGDSAWLVECLRWTERCQ